MFRFKNATDFFYDFDTSMPIEIKTDDLSLVIRYAKNKNGAILNELEGIIYSSDTEIDPLEEEEWHIIGKKLKNYQVFRLFFDGKFELVDGNLATSFRTYIFKKLKEFKQNYRPFLNPPFGENIPSLLISNKRYKELIGAIFREKGFRLMIKPNGGGYQYGQRRK